MRRLATAAATAAALVFAGELRAETADGWQLPYAEAGLDEREAAAALLDRLTFGGRPGDVDRVVALGLGRWLNEQLAGELPDPALDARLARYEALRMNDAQLIARYPSSSQVSAHVRRFHPGLIPGRDEPIMDFSVVTAKLDAYRAERGILSQDVELREQVLAQKIMRAVYAQNQLREVLTDFWQNHFFTSPVNFNARPWILSFERDAVRPNALAGFGTLLHATARHPAMLQYYVGTARPAALSPAETTMAAALDERGREGAATHAGNPLRGRVAREIDAVEVEEDLVLAREFWPPVGPNEIHARALLELQTLGPGGVWTDLDVRETARAFTGWSTVPIGPTSEWFARGFDAAYNAGFVRDGSFLFRADRHDATPKRIFGQDFPAGGGVEEGERILGYLAAQPATARHVARKLAVRFVSDAPPEALVERLAQSFEATQGDVRALLRALVESPEFWQAAADRGKVKTPFELAASALRATGAEVTATRALAERVAVMGQPLYSYLEPTGYPDAGAYWLDPAALLNRIAFARDLAANAIDGVAVDPRMLAGAAAAPETAREAAGLYAARLLPGRELDELLEAVAAAIDGSDFEGMARQAAAVLVASPQFQLR